MSVIYDRVINRIQSSQLFVICEYGHDFVTVQFIFKSIFLSALSHSHYHIHFESIQHSKFKRKRNMSFDIAVV